MLFVFFPSSLCLLSHTVDSFMLTALLSSSLSGWIFHSFSPARDESFGYAEALFRSTFQLNVHFLFLFKMKKAKTKQHQQGPQQQTHLRTNLVQR